MKRLMAIILMIFTLCSCGKLERRWEMSEEEKAQAYREIEDWMTDFLANLDNTEEFSALLDVDGDLSSVETIVRILRYYDAKPVVEDAHWEVTDVMTPLLTTLWDQYEPFNGLCPPAGGESDGKSPAGCFTMAVAQLIAYHAYPPAFTDYPLVKTIKTLEDRQATGTPQAQDAAARFVDTLSSYDLMNVGYVSIGDELHSYCFPPSAVRTLKALGYENVEWEMGIDTAKVVGSLKKGCPVLFSSAEGVVNGHAWVVDGYARRELIDKDGNVVDVQYLLHCNWGWNGKNNGYFESDFFDTRAAVIADDLHPESRDYIFWLGTNTIICNPPD
ncbi:MAG: C10 family peptidase [Bacteroidales bacterium]|nr:C10 family peptidase [Bacteroidales bacterium]